MVKPVRPAALCRGDKADRKLEEVEEPELNRVEEGEDGMSDEGDRTDGEEELAPPGRRAPSNTRTCARTVRWAEGAPITSSPNKTARNSRSGCQKGR